MSRGIRREPELSPDAQVKEREQRVPDLNDWGGNQRTEEEQRGVQYLFPTSKKACSGGNSIHGKLR